ncbi:Zinc finger protein GLI4 [Dissostichus eleginoides]|uniref:Zinc finger protein GLI4 n=1 Tax=Dissostichus eleginoides TaxID=100907 RepID=A0AAD9F2H5_DISEL|nr:Zinc finger protein GLI4 [Dissostichus eleginoides]
MSALFHDGCRPPQVAVNGTCREWRFLLIALLALVGLSASLMAAALRDQPRHSQDLCIIAAWPYQPSLSWYRAASVISPPCNGMLEGPSPPTHRHAEATFKGCRSF